MKLVTYTRPGVGVRAGALESEWIYDLGPSVQSLLDGGPAALDEVRERLLYEARWSGSGWYSVNEVTLLAPLPTPRSLRHFCASDRTDFPAFYFSNTLTVLGPQSEVELPPYSQELDFELEVACIIGRAGRNINPDDAEDYIAGYMILNDWSARDVEEVEKAAGLGPAKSKDFATSTGPWLVTPDELSDRKIMGPGGFRYHLAVTALVNGKECARGSFKDVHYSFSQLIAQASQGVTLHPGEILSSGTVSGGSLLDQGLPWLKPGDVVELHVERLGVLSSKVAQPVVTRV